MKWAPGSPLMFIGKLMAWNSCLTLIQNHYGPCSRTKYQELHLHRDRSYLCHCFNSNIEWVNLICSNFVPLKPLLSVCYFHEIQKSLSVHFRAKLTSRVRLRSCLFCEGRISVLKRRFKTPIQNALHGSTVHASPREEDDFVSMHCALFEAIVRAQVNRKGVYMTSFKRGYMWFCVHASTRISVLL